MAFIVVTTDANFINIDFGDTHDGTKNLYKKGTFKRDHISEVILNEYQNGSGFVSVRFDGEEKAWQCSINTNILAGTYPIDEINSNSIVTLEELYNNLKNLML